MQRSLIELVIIVSLLLRDYQLFTLVFSSFWNFLVYIGNTVTKLIVLLGVCTYIKIQLFYSVSKSLDHS